MTSQHDKPKRWRPRFSVRTLVVVVTLVCCYAACWGPTKKRGVKDVANHIFLRNPHTTMQTEEVNIWLRERCENGTTAISPLVIQYVPVMGSVRYYYFWFFGYVAQLPFEREMGMGEREKLWGELFPDMWPPSSAPPFGSETPPQD